MQQFTVHTMAPSRDWDCSWMYKPLADNEIRLLLLKGHGNNRTFSLHIQFLYVCTDNMDVLNDAAALSYV
jgi:hypothetical protein